jgi:hypothetical protein
LTKFSYPHIHILQYVEFGFPLGLWSNAYLEPSTKNHSSSYSYFSYVDKFVESELDKLGVTGPFDSAPWDDIMLSPMMTSHKKPSSRRTVFDASFGLYSLNNNTPQKSYHETEYEFHFPRIDDLADIIAALGPGCYLFKRDLSRFFLQLKVDPLEYSKLGFAWRGLIFFFVSFVWGCRHAGYCGQWLTSAVSFIHANLGLEFTKQLSARIYLNFPTCKHFSKLTFLFISARVYFGGGNGRTCFDSRLLCLLADQPGFPNCSLCNALVQWTSSALTSFCCHYVM